MKTPSRRMPAAPVRKPSRLAWLFLAAMLVGLGYWIYRQPIVVLFIIGLAVLVGIQIIFESRFRRRLAASRGRESICDFARSFDRRTDTWIIRAVYEELCRFLSVDGRPLHVRRADSCEKDLKVDPEDLDDLAREIGFRAGRSMDGSGTNPLYGKVKTVGDMVTFFEHQPRSRNVEPDCSGNRSRASHPE